MGFRLVSNILDLVPIVGTVKNTAEAVVALSDGDVKLAAEKGLQAVVGGVLDVVTFGVGSATERMIVKGVERGGQKLVTKTVAKGVSKTAVKEAVPLVRLTVSMLAQMRQQRQPEERRTTKKRPSRRGEHVINNNVLKFFRSVIEDFMSAEMHGHNFDELVSEGRITPNMQVYQARENPLTPPYKTAVQKELVAQLDEPFYMDANAVEYGYRIKQVRGSIVSYMTEIYHNNHSHLPQKERTIIDTVEEFIAGEYFVDQYALSVWLTKGGTMARYEDVKAKVVQMFRRAEYHDGNDEIIQWVRELTRAIST